MDPRLTAVVDHHGRCDGAPAELVALLGPGRSHVVTDGLHPSWFASIPADRVSLVGQLGGMVVVRCDEHTTVTAALSGGAVHQWRGQPGALAVTDGDDVELESVTLLWRLLDEQATLPAGPPRTVVGEVAARVLLAHVLGDSMQTGDVAHVDEAVGAFAAGALRPLARLAGLPRPPGRLHPGYLREVLTIGGHRRVPVPTGTAATDLRYLHRSVPLRWQIAADLTEYLGRPAAAKLILACNPRWTSSAA